MMLEDKNPYYSPESFGLEMVDSVHWDDESYQFNMSVVWKAGRGKYYIADDSGCSCPSPFEDATLEDLDGPMNKRSLEAALRYRVKERNVRPLAQIEKDVRELLARLT